MRRFEEQHNTPEQVREYLAAALATVEELAPPKDLREIAFSQAVALHSAKQLFWEQMPAIPNLRPH